jgi:hypothetical protein
MQQRRMQSVLYVMSETQSRRWVCRHGEIIRQAEWADFYGRAFALERVLVSWTICLFYANVSKRSRGVTMYEY